MFINIDSKTVEVDVIVKPTNKGTYLRVKNNKIVITSYKKLSVKEISNFVEEYKNKILEILANNDKRADFIHLLGKEYNLKINIGTRLSRIENNKLVIYAKSFDDEDIKKAINEVYFNILSDILKKNHLEYEKKFNVLFQVCYEIKDVKTYFGKCYFKENRVVLATKLAKYPMELILSVLGHELTHFFVHDHSLRFYEYIEKRIPGYYKLQHELRAIKYQDKF